MTVCYPDEQWSVVSGQLSAIRDLGKGISMSHRLTLICVSLCVVAAAPPVRYDPLANLVPRSIGPAVMSGRITSLSVVESNPKTQYIGAASGGVWKTTDEGKTWACVFAGRPHASIGAVSVSHSHPEVVWVGTGEANARNSVSWGNGVFVSRDAGKTWMHAGLADTHHIGRIAVHPTDPNIAYVAALGHIWGANAERGLFGTTDGGKTWQHLLKLDHETGCIDVALDPSDPATIYAAAYRVKRDAFAGNNPAVQTGPLAGIYKSTDAGETWSRLTRGLPSNKMGRIGLHVYRKDTRMIWAVVQTERTDIRNVAGQLMGYGPLETGGVFVSRDRGESWVKVNNLCPRPFYFGQIRVDPGDSRRVWVLGIPLYVSLDGGRSFSAEGARGVHLDHHDMWINPKDTRHLVLVTDGGHYTSYNSGLSWTHATTLPISQFYAIAVDQSSPYRILGGLQDNGTWMSPSREENWKHLLGMDGFGCAFAPDDPNLVYAQGQNGRLHRIDATFRTGVSIMPRSAHPGGATYRFNWSAPLQLSAHETKTIYYGANHLFKSADMGQTWRRISPELTKGEPWPAESAGHTLTTIAESRLQKGLLYVGSDDGLVHVTRDDGKTWTDLTKKLPNVKPSRWITRLECSAHRPQTAWLSLSRHREADRAPYLFVTEDHGETWRSIVGNLPKEGPIHVVRNDPHHANLLFVGTEFGVYVSLDAGVSWRPLCEKLPPCPVHDLVIQTRDRELVIATHGRGIYLVNIAALQDAAPKGRQSLMVE
jgi:photosystem II stability/assembly factor-like uncharacterized protein